MRHKAIWITLILTGWLIGLSSAFAIEDEEASPYFDRKKEGWFWLWMKKTPAKPPPPERETVKGMRERAETLLNRALEAPSVEHVEAYLVHQKKLLDRSEEVARIWKLVLMEHPELDATVGHPLSAVGADFARAARAREKDRILLDLAGQAGLLYFFSGDCAVCPVQGALLASLANSYRFRVIPISLDGSADPAFPETRIDRGAAGRLNVQTVPALFLIRPPDRVRRIGTGLLTSEEIADRLILLEEADKAKSKLDGPVEKEEIEESDETP